MGNRSKIKMAAIKLFSTFFFLWTGLLCYGQSKVVRPYAEYANTGYVVFAAIKSSRYEYSQIVKQVLTHLPEGVDAVFLLGSGGKQSAQWGHSSDNVMNYFSQYIQRDRIKVVRVDSDDHMLDWGRDYLPIPVHTIDESRGVEGVSLVNHGYRHGPIEASDEISRALRHPISSRYNAPFEGGNFLADEEGNCYVVNNDKTRLMADDLFSQHYGCSAVIRFPHRSGIGHIDERVKIISQGLAVTDSEEYKAILQAHGNEVHLLPAPHKSSFGPFRSYVSALLINGVVFMPTFGMDLASPLGAERDAKAAAVYRSLGLEVHTVETPVLTDIFLGGIHCLAMLYPRHPEQLDP